MDKSIVVKKIKNFCKEWNIDYIIGIPYNPQGTQNIKTLLIK